MRIFLSYDMNDHNLVDRMQHVLYKIDNTEPLVVENISSAGTPIIQKVTDYLNDCHAMIVILTRSSITNQWVNQEMGYAFAKKKMIIPLLEFGTHVKGFLADREFIQFNRSQFDEAIKNTLISLYNQNMIFTCKVDCNSCMEKNNVNLLDIFDSHFHEVLQMECRKCRQTIEFSGDSLFFHH